MSLVKVTMLQGLMKDGGSEAQGGRQPRQEGLQRNPWEQIQWATVCDTECVTLACCHTERQNRVQGTYTLVCVQEGHDDIRQPAVALQVCPLLPLLLCPGVSCLSMHTIYNHELLSSLK